MQLVDVSMRVTSPSLSFFRCMYRESEKVKKGRKKLLADVRYVCDSTEWLSEFNW